MGHVPRPCRTCGPQQWPALKAAEAGKQVACVIELMARFDEERNLHWAAELERAGAHVVFGVRGLKTHAKTALVVRKEPSGLRSYGSADWMFRNLSRRVEVVTPVTAPGPKQRLWEILDICLRDHRQAWVLNSDGSYAQLRSEGSGAESEAVGTHATLMELTRHRSRPLAG